MAQLVFTDVPFLPRLFESQSIALADGALIVGANVALMLLLEGEKKLPRRIGLFDERRSWPAERGTQEARHA